MNNFLNNIQLYFQFLTRVPINKNLNCDEKNFRDGIFAFVLVGAFLGIINYGILLMVRNILPSIVISGFMVLIPIMLTGGMQMDGLGDTCDGFFAFKEGGKERRIEIMKDSNVGTFAVIAIIWFMVMKLVLLNELIVAHEYWGVFMYMVLSRLGVMFSAKIAKRAKPQGTGNLYIENSTVKGIVIALIICCGLATIFGGIIETVTIIPIMFFVVWFFNKYCNKKIGGQTGDTLGATNEICELVALILMVMLTV
ncbi:adenosylcobinamide-GDP ribazoletransferase [Oceanirhabdus sp. W0125-5]|uniref:adenosylcobinamide-GDP ribazoletransferase n=1 Tax=Oceanirhabdus sp. W0125-5 TaxID=2999116 RepID=UPI0022F2E647|nr:adenosylcobinamide-GDP ribazoletransferase [Oceanirhabdus sp. W0125-5]WBW98938.1 adenosylcobinamide-GDP ribazoletransferase [Oceanirhabdus sp. W0125-5]